MAETIAVIFWALMFVRALDWLDDPVAREERRRIAFLPIGRAGKDFIMSDSWRHGPYLCHRFDEITAPPQQGRIAGKGE